MLKIKFLHMIWVTNSQMFCRKKTGYNNVDVTFLCGHMCDPRNRCILWGFALHLHHQTLLHKPNSTKCKCSGSIWHAVVAAFFISFLAKMQISTICCILMEAQLADIILMKKSILMLLKTLLQILKALGRFDIWMIHWYLEDTVQDISLKCVHSQTYLARSRWSYVS